MIIINSFSLRSRQTHSTVLYCTAVLLKRQRQKQQEEHFMTLFETRQTQERESLFCFHVFESVNLAAAA